MADATQEIEPDLRKITQTHNVQFTHNHIGAANWAPFGNKPLDQIQSHTLSLFEEIYRRSARIGRDVVLKMIQWEVDEGHFTPRTLPGPESELQLHSYTAIDDHSTATVSLSETHSALDPAKKMVNSLYPDIAKAIRFFAIPPLQTPSEFVTEGSDTNHA
jgi:hypothetical protein